MYFTLNFDLLWVGLAGIAIAILGVVVFTNNRKSLTNKSFLLFCFLTICYGFFNFINYKVTTPELILLFLRLTIFFAVWHAFSFFQLFYVFPNESVKFPKLYTLLIIPITIITAILTLTPLVFSRIEQVAGGGQVSNPVRGPAVAVFGIVAFGLIIGGIVLLSRKMLAAYGIERQQYRLILAGTSITFTLILFFNFVLPVIFVNLSYIPLAPVYIFPLIIFTAYAIIKYHLFNVKVIATQLLTFALWIFLLVRALLSTTLDEQVINGGLFVLTVVVGIFLIRSVLREVEQREKLEKVTKELELANVELKRLDESKSEFISIASHQLRTPLTIIKGFISMINEGSFGRVPPRIREQLVKVFASNERLIALVEDLLNLSRIESGRQEYHWKENDLAALATSVVENLTKNAEAKGLKLKLLIPKAKVPLVVCDADKLHEVMMNFVDNAIKYTPAGSVTVSLEAKPAGMVTFAVKDTGMGIAPQNMGYLFQKFSRVKGSFLVQPGGSGLGLYVAKKIVDVHEGKIWAESPGEGKGTTFAFSLPVAGPKVRPQPKAAIPTAQTTLPSAQTTPARSALVTTTNSTK